MSQSKAPPLALSVFAKVVELPDEVTVPILGAAAERISGYDSVFGAQLFGALWRIYPHTEKARALLLSAGISVHGRSVRLYDKNPFTLNDGVAEIPTTRLTVDGIPISASDSDLEGQLKSLGVTLRSPIRLEWARDANGRLTHWVTGRRMIWIDVPKVSLPVHTKVGIFRARLFYREQERQQPKCHNCLEVGHFAATCSNEVVCRACKQRGHKQGDPICGGPSVGGMSAQRGGDREERRSEMGDSDKDDEVYKEAQEETISYSGDGESEESEAEKEGETEENLRDRENQKSVKGGGAKDSGNDSGEKLEKGRGEGYKGSGGENSRGKKEEKKRTE